MIDKSEHMFYNFKHNSIGTGGIHLDEEHKKMKLQLINMISKIEKAGTIEYLHTFIKLFLKEWG